MKPVVRILLVILTVVSAGILASPRSASAHPMGNFSINQYTALTLGTHDVKVHYVVDMAEIPAFQELGTIRADRNTDLTPQERDSYIKSKSADLQKGLSVSVEGKPVPLTLEGTTLSFPLGNGGLPTLRIEMELSAPVDGTHAATLEYKDTNYSERIGWKEVIAKSGEGVTLKQSSVPASDLSQGLTKYNPDLLKSAPTVTSATVSFVPGSAAAPSGQTRTGAAPTIDLGVGEFVWVQEQTRAITSVLGQKEIPLAAMMVALLLAFLAGAAHALSPGHGKAVVAAYMVGSRGTPLHAIILGATITFSHTIGVFILGFIVLGLADYILPETLYPWMKFSSGMMLAVLGITLFVQRFRAWKRSTARSHEQAEEAHTHDHDHAHEHGLAHSHDHETDHNHDHGHDHDHDHAAPHKHGMFSKPHSHLPADGQQVTLGGLLALGITGGIIPCPSALIVLLFAVQLGKVALGLLLILAFSLGLAVVISVIGLLMVYSRGILNKAKVNSGLLLRLPMFSALAVSCLGLFLAYGAFTTR